MANVYPMLLLLMGVLGLAHSIPWDVQTPLEEYYWKEIPGDRYRYKLHDHIYVPGTSVYVLRMTSLAWRNRGLTNRNIWKHWVTIVIPDDIRVYDKAMIRFEGGQLNDKPVKQINFNPVSERLFKFSYDTGAVAAEITNIPSQNLKFKGEDDSRWEDDILARSFSLYAAGHYNNTDHFIFSPMMRAARRGIDTVIEYARQVNPALQIQNVMASGRSKRGWLTWLLGGVDRRVFAIHPEAFSQTNYDEFLYQQYQSLGGWSYAGLPYYREATAPNALFNPRGAFLFEEFPLDPMQFFERMHGVPMLLVLSPGDEFFQPDASWHFWQHIQGTKYLRLVENTSHRFRGRYDEIWDNMATFFMMLTQGSGPSVSWERETDDDGNQQMTVTLDREPNLIRTWCADTTDQTTNMDPDGSTTHRRDFREIFLTPSFQFVRNQIIWTEDGPLQDLGDNVYSTSVTAPPDGGFRACFVEMRFDGFDPSDPHLNEFVVNSEVIIAPAEPPYPRCTSFEQCVGVIR